MPKKCKSCGGTFEPAQRDGTTYFHECSPEVIQHAVTDALGNVTVPEVRTPRPNPRNENIDDSPAAVKAAARDANGNPMLGPKAAGAGV